MSEPSVAHASPFSSVPGRPSFRSASLNAVAMVPLLSTNNQGGENNSHSSQSFHLLLESLRRYSKNRGSSSSVGDSTMSEVPLDNSVHNGTSNDNDNDNDDEQSAQGYSRNSSHVIMDDLLVVVPNGQLTRPGDWRYDQTPLKSFHWGNGCQRMLCFDGRPDRSRMAHDRLLNSAVGRDWIDIMPSRRTAAVVGILNMKDIPTLETFQRAQHELSQWAERFSTPPYEVTAHGRNFARDGVVTRLFVFDSFDEECQKRIDLTKLGSSMIAFPPSDDAHHHMMDLHLNVVLNDLAVAIFRELETKIQESDAVSKGGAATRFGSGNKRSNASRFIGGGGGATNDGPTHTANKIVSIKDIASVVNPENQLAAGMDIDSDNNSKNPVKNARKALNTMAETAGKLMQNPKKNKSTQAPQLLTPLDDVWDSSELNPRDAEAMKKRDVARREKLAADLSLLAGSPIDAYERYTRAAALTKEAHDPLWYTASLQGCAAAFCAMADSGGHCVDEYLDNNFQHPDNIMTLARETDARGKVVPLIADKSKTTLSAAVFALCEEALSITNRHPKLAAFHVELLLKLAHYTVEMEVNHLRCLWGKGESCYEGDMGEPPRWERTTVSKCNFEAIAKKEGKELLWRNTFQRCQKWTNLMHRAVCTGALDPRTRADVAAACARMSLGGLEATEWGDIDPRRLVLNRKAAFFTVVAAEALSQCQDDSTRAGSLWLAACQAYTRTGNLYDTEKSHYGWATLRASTLHALSQQEDHVSAEAAVELLLALLSGVPTHRASNAIIMDRAPSVDDTESVVPRASELSHKIRSQNNIGIGEGKPIPDNSSLASNYGKKVSGGRNVFVNGSASSSLLIVAQSKWTDDEPIPLVPLPLVDPNHIATGSRHCTTLDASLSRSLISLNSVLPKIRADSCGMAQKRCLALIADLRQELPTLSIVGDGSLQQDTFPIYGKSALSVPPPLRIVSAKAVRSESHLLLERSKAVGFSGKAGFGAMSTFFNPYENKKKQEEKKKIQANLVAEGEERAVLIEFANSLSVPLGIPSCQLEFEAKNNDRIKAPPLSFIVPAKAHNFAVHFPFYVIAQIAEEQRKENPVAEVTVDADVFEVIGLRVTCLNRSFFIPVSSPAKKENPQDGIMEGSDRVVPEPASVYQRSKHNKAKKEEEQIKPRFEAVPPQPHLLVSFTTSQRPIEDGTTVPVHLSDGEIFTIPPFRLQNNFGASGMGTMKRLQILGVGLPGLPEEILYDTDKVAAAREEDETTDSDESDSQSSDFQDLMELDGLPPLKMRAICDGLSLKSINDKSIITGSIIRFQIAATHDMGNQLKNGGNVRIRFRYRGVSPTPATEIWRKREVSLRIIRVKGPRISSLTFRSDLSWGSAYSELCQSLAQQKIQRETSLASNRDPLATAFRGAPPPVSTTEQESSSDVTIEDSVLKRVGVDPGVHVSGNDVVVLMAVANETNATIVLSNRKGLVGGFQGSPMPTVRVTSGVSVKIPVVIPRIDRMDDTRTVTDIATELVSRTALQWETEVVGGASRTKNNNNNNNRRTRQGRVRIPSRCLREIIAEHPSFAARICQPPVSIHVRVCSGSSSKAPTTTSPPPSSGSGTTTEPHKLVVVPGMPVDAFVEWQTAHWVPKEVQEKCTIAVEFCCARKGESMEQHNDTDRCGGSISEQLPPPPPYTWCGQVMRTIGGTTTETDQNQNQTHRARIVFLECGSFVVSACARVVCHNKDGTKNGSEETWWAPQAEQVQVEPFVPPLT